jgi:hypothetical protein
MNNYEAQLYAVTEAALIKRINRKLAAHGERVRKTRGERGRIDRGDFYVIDIDRNIDMLWHVDIEVLARKLGVLSVAESLAGGRG